MELVPNLQEITAICDFTKENHKDILSNLKKIKIKEIAKTLHECEYNL
jgi:hypothetical protein